jgi:hypothetical protein
MTRTYKISAALLAGVGLVAALAIAESFRPVSAADRAKIENLLKSFDPNSYEVKLPYVDAQGKLRVQTLGKAKGLASLIQSKTKRPGQGANSDAVLPMVTVTAKGNVIVQSNGIIMGKEGFGKPALMSKMRELNLLLNKYIVAK